MKRIVTTEGYKAWIDACGKGINTKHLDVDFRTRKYEPLAHCTVDIDTAKYENKVKHGFYSSYVYAALDDVMKDFKSMIADATKDDAIPDDMRIQRDAYLSQISVPVFEVYAIDDTNREDVTIFLKGVA